MMLDFIMMRARIYDRERGYQAMECPEMGNFQDGYRAALQDCLRAIDDEPPILTPALRGGDTLETYVHSLTRAVKQILKERIRHLRVP